MNYKLRFEMDSVINCDLGVKSRLLHHKMFMPLLYFGRNITFHVVPDISV
jgi:hypothetical protein